MTGELDPTWHLAEATGELGKIVHAVGRAQAGVNGTPDAGIAAALTAAYDGIGSSVERLETVRLHLEAAAARIRHRIGFTPEQPTGDAR